MEIKPQSHSIYFLALKKAKAIRISDRTNIILYAMLIGSQKVRISLLFSPFQRFLRSVSNRLAIRLLKIELERVYLTFLPANFYNKGIYI